MSILDKFLNAMKLNDDDYDDDDFLDSEEDEYEEPRPKKSLFRKSGREEPLLERWAFAECAPLFEDVFGIQPVLVWKSELLA